MEAHETVSSDEDNEHNMLVQKIYSFGNEMGCNNLIEVSKKLNEYYPTRAYEEESGVHEVIRRYNEDSFWDELIDRLAERDAHADAKTANVEINSAEDYWKFSTPHESKYADEFEKNGLRNLHIRGT